MVELDGQIDTGYFDFVDKGHPTREEDSRFEMGSSFYRSGRQGFKDEITKGSYENATGGLP